MHLMTNYFYTDWSVLMPKISIPIPIDDIEYHGKHHFFLISFGNLIIAQVAAKM